MTDLVEGDEDEERRLRERLRAKSQKQNRSDRNGNGLTSRHAPVQEKGGGGSAEDRRRRSLSPVHDRRNSDNGRQLAPARRGDDDRGPPHRRNYHPGGPYRDDRGDYYDRRGPPPPHHRDMRGGDDRGRRYGGPPPPHYYDDRYPPARGHSYRDGRRYDNEYEDDFGRRRRPSPPRHRRSHHRSSSRRRSRSRSRSSYSSEEDDRDRDGQGTNGRSRYDRGRRRRSRSRSLSRSPSSRSSSRSSRDDRSRRSYSRSPSSDSSVASRRSSSQRRSDKDGVSSDADTNCKSQPKGPASEAREMEQNLYSKDQRTIFVTQLVQRATEKDLKRYFSKDHNFKVNEVILLRDKRTGRHKGCAYIELNRMEDVAKAVALSNQPPSFQRFPILVKASEAEKNYLHTMNNQNSALTAAQMGKKISSGPLVGPNGKLLEAQKLYVGSLDPSVTQEHLFVLYSQFGQLEKVALQVDAASGISKGFAFLSFRDPKEANLAIQTMSNQVLAGRPMKTGWAVNQIASFPQAQIVTSDEFPPDASSRATNAYKILGQLTMGVPISQVKAAAAATSGTMSVSPPVNGSSHAAAGSASSSRIPTVAEARASLVAGQGGVGAAPMNSTTVAQSESTPASDDFTKIGNEENPSTHILVHNMFDKDQETEPGWEEDIREEFKEECSKFGRLVDVIVMSKQAGGKIYASFETQPGAKNCASSLAGRWFDRRRLRVEFVASMPSQE